MYRLTTTVFLLLGAVSAAPAPPKCVDQNGKSVNCGPGPHGPLGQSAGVNALQARDMNKAAADITITRYTDSEPTAAPQQVQAGRQGGADPNKVAGIACFNAYKKRIPCPKRGGGQAGGQTGGQTMVQAGGQAGGQGNSVQQRPGQHRSPQSQSSGGKRVVDVRMLSCFRPETGESTPCSPDLLAREGALDANFPHGGPASSQGQGGTVQAQQPRPQGQAMQPPTQQVQSGGQQQVAEQQQPPQLGQGGQVSTQQTEQPTDGSSSPKDPELDAAIRDFLSKNDIPNKTGPHTDNKPPPASTTTRVDATLNIDEDGTLGDGETKTTSDTSEEKETASASSQPPPVPEMVPTPKATPSLSPERLARYGNSPS